MSREQRCPRCDTVLREHDVLCPRCTLAESLDTEALSASGPGFLDDLPLTGDSLLIADRYRVVETIARGGMGVVYKAWQENLGRVVAVKMLLGGIHAADSFKKRFVQEAKAAARLQHPCIVKIFDWGEDNGQPYFSMEYVEGETLTRLAAVQPLEPLHAAALVKRIAEAIGYAHEQGILHRDLKPSNVLVDKAGNVRITDFGLAKDQTIHDLTASGEAMGSPGYSPPEQLNGENSKIGPESDVYGLGAVLYYLITGRPPFVASSLHESFRAVNESPPVSPRLLNSSVPRDLETICLACLEKNPGQRYRTAFELGLELERYLSNQPIRRRPITPMERGWRWCKRQPVIASLLLILALVLNGGIWGILRQQAKTAAANRELAGALVRSELQTANSLLEQKDVGGGLAYLADLARQFPTNHVVSSRLLNALNESAFPIPMFGPVHQGGGFTWMRFPLNGKYLVTIAHDGAVRLLSPQNGQVVAGPFPYSSSITNADVSPDGELLAGIGPNNTIQVMQLRTGKILPPVVHPEVFSVAFGLEGELISRSADGVEVVWDIVARKEVRKGGALAWDVGGAEEVRKRFGKEARVLRALMPAFSDVGRSVCTGLVYYTNSVYPQVSALIWDKATGELLSWPSSTGVAGVASNIFQMSNVVITASASGAAVDIIARGKAGVYARCDALGGKLILAENLASDFPATYLSTSNPEFSVGYNEQSSEFYVYGFVRGEAPKRVATEKRVDHLSAWEASLTGQALAVGGANGIVFVLHAPAGVRKDWSAIQPIRLRDPIQSLAFNADSRHLAVLLRTGDLWEWDVPPYIPCEDYTFTVGEEGFGLASPDGTRALLFESTDDWGFYYNLVSLPDRKPILKLPKSNVGFFFRDSRYFFHARDWPLSGVAITNGIFIRSAINGDLLGTIQGEGFALDAEALMTGDLGLNGQFLLTEVGGRSACFDVRAGALASFLPQGLRYGRFHEGGNQISGVIRNKLVVVRTGDGALVREYTVDGSVFDKLTVPPNFSHDAKWVLLTTERTVEVVDLARQTRIKAPFDSGAPITSVGFSPNGDLAFAAANDGTVILWNPSSALSGLRMLRHPIAEVAVKPANGAVLTISSDGSRLWDPSTGELLYRGRQFEGSWLPDVITEFYHANLEVSRLSWACFGARSLVHEDVFSTHEPIPSLVPDLVEALAGEHVKGLIVTPQLQPERLFEYRKQLQVLDPKSECLRLAKWIFSDSSTRTVTPNSRFTSTTYAERLAMETNAVSASMAAFFRPGSPEGWRAQASMALGYAPRRAEDQRFDVDAESRAKAYYWTRQLVRTSPDNGDDWLLSAKALQSLNQDDQALAAAQRSFQLAPTCVECGLFVGEMLARNGKTQEAKQTLNDVLARTTTNDLALLSLQPRVWERIGLDSFLDAKVLKAVGLEPRDNFALYERVVSSELRKRNASAAFPLQEALLGANPEKPAVGFYFGVKLAWLGEVELYDRWRRIILEKFAGTTNYTAAEQIAKTCLLLPQDAALLAESANLAQRAVELLGADSSAEFAKASARAIASPYVAMAEAMAKIRKGEYVTVDSWVSRGHDGADNFTHASLLSLSAIVSARENDIETAKRLHRSAAKIASALPTRGSIEMLDRIDEMICRMLFEEAGEAIGRMNAK